MTTNIITNLPLKVCVSLFLYFVESWESIIFFIFSKIRSPINCFIVENLEITESPPQKKYLFIWLILVDTYYTRNEKRSGGIAQ